MGHRFLHLDVFTDRPLEGNQLAVFVDGQDVPADLMQAIAKEMAFSETTFVQPARTAGTDVGMRIFTPASELPVAGHPTVGTTFALAHEGVIEVGRSRFVFDLGVGPTPVDLEWDGARLHFAWMTQGLPQFGRAFDDRAAVAGLVNLGADALANLPAPQVVSCGVPFMMVPLPSRREVDAASPRLDRLDEFFAREGHQPVGLFLFAPDAEGDAEGTRGVYSRMFAPTLGVFEDPATGIASGPVGCYMVANDMAPGGTERRIMSLQGFKMGRPSRILIEITTTGSDIARVRIGGSAVLVGEGTLL